MIESLTVEQKAAIEQVETADRASVDLNALVGETLPIGSGHVVFDDVTGSPVAFVDDTNPDRHFLLDSSVGWHTSDYIWGSGSVVTDIGSAQWIVPQRRELRGVTQKLDFTLCGSGLTLTVLRTGGDRLAEHYEWCNVTSRPITIIGLGIQTPFNDRYPGAKKALTECVNTHVFTGGAWSWVEAVPMDGKGRRLGLIVTDGELNAYSIQSRNQITYSNVRGHMVLQVTDRAVNPESFGGQPVITLAPGECYTLAWRIGFYDDEQSFMADTNPPAVFSSLSSTVGGEIQVVTDLPVQAIRSGLRVNHIDSGVSLTTDVPGVYQLALGEGDKRCHTEVLFHKSLKQTVNDRVRWIIDHQVARERVGALAGAMVATDVRTGRHFIDSSWNDWSDGSERVCMPVLLQRALNMGYLDKTLRKPAQQAADAWRKFAEAELIDASGACRRGSGQSEGEFGGRLYDVPWFTNFYAEHYIGTRDPHDLDMLVTMMDRAAEIGGERFLAIEFAETHSTAAKLLDAAGRHQDAERIRMHVLASADHFLDLGMELPYHEVSYEQSIAAPLVSLLIEAHRITGEAKYLAGLRERLQWLLSFSGPQPDCRLFGVGIRHWDGYWFGIKRQFGDVFPHYWSALTAEVLARLPEELRSEKTERLAMAIFEANMANYNADGSATCAYLFPSNVDGRAMHAADPLANDQDWHLNIWLRMIREEGFPGHDRGRRVIVPAAMYGGDV